MATFFRRRIIRILQSSGSVGWGIQSLGRGNGTQTVFNLPYSDIGQLIVIVDGIIQPPDIYSISVGTGPGGRDQLVFADGNAPALDIPVEAAGTHS